LVGDDDDQAGASIVVGIVAIAMFDDLGAAERPGAPHTAVLSKPHVVAIFLRKA
jgi:hypothetical protein